MIWWSAHNGQIAEGSAFRNRLRNEKSSLIGRLLHDLRKLQSSRKNIFSGQVRDRLHLVEAFELRWHIERSLQSAELHLHDQVSHDVVAHLHVVNSHGKVLQLRNPLVGQRTIWK